MTTCLWANPTGGSVAAGVAHIAGQGTSAVTVSQSSNLAIINWQTFSINSGESTSFLQPSATSAALNRVLGGQTSLINGTLSANGQVYLINGNGIIIGPGGAINAGAFTASTRDITDADFLSGNLHFTSSSSAGVQNLGTIKAIGGNVVLIGKTVDNEGTITAPNGTAGLVAGDDVLLAQKNADGSTITVSPQTTTTSSSGQVGVKNSGVITAAAAELKAANGNIYALAVQNEGTIRATTITHQGGHIWLTSDSGTVSNSGTLNASATAAGGQGGTVTLKSATGKASHTGQIIAQGGVGGQGGNAEISGAEVEFTGEVDLTAPGGVRGTLLLDPATIDIVTGGGPDVTASTIDPSAVVAALNGANLILTGTTSITVDDTVDASANPSAGNLTLDTPLLNLNAGIILNGALSGTANTVNVGPSGLIQNGVDALAATGGSVNLTGGVAYNLTNEIVFNKNVVMNGNGAVIDGGDTTRDMEVDGGIVSLVDLTLSEGVGVSTAGAAGGIWNYDGGALLIYGLNTTANVILTNCSVIGNTANAGGAIFNVSIVGGSTSLQMFNCTVFGNTSINGSALYNYGSSGGNASMNLTLCTITGNVGNGGIYNTLYSGGNASVSIDSSILAANTDNFGNESDYVNGGGGTLTDLGYNLYGQNGNAGGFVPGSMGSTDIPLDSSIATVLGPYGDYGGGLDMFPLVQGSPALDAGNSTYLGKSDERGVTRGDASDYTDGGVDIGAFQAQFISVQADPISVVYGETPTFTYTITNGPATASVSLSGGLALESPATDVGFYGEDIGQGTLTSVPLYLVDFTEGDLTITPRPVTVEPDAGQGKVYGSADPVLTYTTGPADATTGLVNGDTLSGSPSYNGSGQFTNVGTYATNLGTLFNPNYSIGLSAVAPTFAITPAVLSYVADLVAVPVGSASRGFSGTVTGFLGEDTLANATTGTLVFNSPVTPMAPAGYYPIDGSGLAANYGNYVFVQAMANATALTIGTPVTPVTIPTIPPASQPNTPVSQAIAQTTTPTTSDSQPGSTSPTGSLPAGTTPPLPPGVPPTVDMNVDSISPNEFVDGSPDSSSGGTSSSGTADTGSLAQGSSFTQGSSAPANIVAVGQTVTLGGGAAGNVPPPPAVQAVFAQIFGSQSQDSLAGALSATGSTGFDSGASTSTTTTTPASTSTPGSSTTAASAATTTTTSTNPPATGPATVVAPGQTVSLAGGKAANVPPPAPVQVAFDQGFSPATRNTLASAAFAGGASANPHGQAPAGATTMVAPGQTVSLSGGRSVSLPPPPTVQAAFDQGFNPQSRATLSQAAGL